MLYKSLNAKAINWLQYKSSIFSSFVDYLYTPVYWNTCICTYITQMHTRILLYTCTTHTHAHTHTLTHPKHTHHTHVRHLQTRSHYGCVVHKRVCGQYPGNTDPCHLGNAQRSLGMVLHHPRPCPACHIPHDLPPALTRWEPFSLVAMVEAW